jgi:Cof subfamily protein (haloacid dehalogenase superfamily)
MTYKMVFFDIDGTLVNEEKKLSEDTIDAVRELQARGIPAIIATGRAPYFDSYVSLNGAYTVYKDHVLFKRILKRDQLKNLVTHASKNNHSIVFQGSDIFYASTELHPFVLEAVNSLKVEQMPGHDPDYWMKADVYQAFLHCVAEEEHLYENVLPGLRLVRWHPMAMDVLPIGGSKAQGIEAMLKHLGIAPEEAVAFGDGLNDKEMLTHVGLGIAMGNAHAELKPYADYVTTHVDEGGIRNGLRHAGLIG